MNFRISDTFTASLAKLTGDEQKAVKTTAFDLQMNLANSGMSFHKLDGARDKNFWSIRVNNNIRIIIHKTESNLLLCYVDHHDKAYQWAERRKIETHPKTGAAQLVEIRELVEVIPATKITSNNQPILTKKFPFMNISDDVLLSYGIPEEWLDEVRQSDEDSILDVAEHLPSEAAEALLDIATGEHPQISPQLTPETDPFDHPDAKLRFTKTDAANLTSFLEDRLMTRFDSDFEEVKNFVRLFVESADRAINKSIRPLTEITLDHLKMAEAILRLEIAKRNKYLGKVFKREIRYCKKDLQTLDNEIADSIKAVDDCRKQYEIAVTGNIERRVSSEEI